MRGRLHSKDTLTRGAARSAETHFWSRGRAFFNLSRSNQSLARRSYDRPCAVAAPCLSHRFRFALSHTPLSLLRRPPQSQLGLGRRWSGWLVRDQAALFAQLRDDGVSGAIRPARLDAALRPALCGQRAHLVLRVFEVAARAALFYSYLVFLPVFAARAVAFRLHACRPNSTFDFPSAPRVAPTTRAARAARDGVARRAREALDEGASGAVSLATVRRRFDASRHPAVASGERARLAVLDEAQDIVMMCRVRVGWLNHSESSSRCSTSSSPRSNHHHNLLALPPLPRPPRRRWVW